jgi:hypothetical protein
MPLPLASAPPRTRSLRSSLPVPLPRMIPSSAGCTSTGMSPLTTISTSIDAYIVYLFVPCLPPLLSPLCVRCDSIPRLFLGTSQGRWGRPSGIEPATVPRNFSGTVGDTQRESNPHPSPRARRTALIRSEYKRPCIVYVVSLRYNHMRDHRAVFPCRVYAHLLDVPEPQPHRAVFVERRRPCRPVPFRHDDA